MSLVMIKTSQLSPLVSAFCETYCPAGISAVAGLSQQRVQQNANLFRDATLLSTSFVFGPLFRKIQARIHQRVLLTRSIAHVDSHLPVVHFAESAQPLTLHTHRIVATLFVGRWIKDNYTIILTKFSTKLPGQFLQQWLMIPRCTTHLSMGTIPLES